MRTLVRKNMLSVVKSFVVNGVLCAVFLWSFLGLVDNAQAETMTVSVAEDTFIDSAHPNTNFGTRAYLIVRDTTTYSCALVKFNAITLPEDAVLDSAIFQFEIIDHIGTAVVVRAGAIARAWRAESATWNHGPGQSPIARLISFPRLSLDEGMREIDYTNVVAAWRSGEIENHGVYICDPADDDDRSFHFTSSEVGDPHLRVSYHLEADPVEPAEMIIPFELRSPDDGDEIDDTTPKFKWTDVDERYDIAELILIVNQITDDEDDVEEVIREEFDPDETSYTAEEELAEGDYRWYMEAYWGGAPVHRTESRGFEIELADEEESEDEAAEAVPSTSSEDATYGDDARSESFSDTITVSDVQNESSEDEGVLEDDEGESITISKRSLINTLWGIIGVLIIAGLVGWFLWYKKKKDKKVSGTASKKQKESSMNPKKK